ncbi:Translation initiation inhibitor [Lactococcus cremoris subsp. cremoris UC509.9]|uniref:RidA family protein n=1 Tax=Lactococcus lactis subsp. cremoris TaxID=1359 RepID=A0AAJ6N2V2_LACLC|nr:RidA family protein [Lactococcus cremoris]AFW91766.1 Translation initiation inhibitor [Lactococcus cremoris subsp. cremoris UC509.9]ARD91478.1 RidA family protein [Lactococcus cremoris]MRM68122.1 regulator [Lactococcus cremoris]QJD20028.1 RidA family protein [Lactococcus cremoris]QRZ29994.1 Translation initiation inhibitor [Lactococcus cremoris]
MNIIATPNAPAAIGPYVQGKIVNGLLYASGQIPLNPLDGEIVGDTIELQTEQVMKNIAAILKEAHSNFDSVIKTTCFLKNIEDFSKFNAIYSKFFNKNFPARSAVGVAGLPKEVLIEIEFIAEIKY